MIDEEHATRAVAAGGCAVYAAVVGEDDRAEAEATAILDDAERSRAARFRFDADRRDYVAAHALLRRSLSRHAGAPPEAWRFVADGYGKPSIAEPSGVDRLEFSLSHTRGLVACGVTTGAPVGVDVERLRELDDALALAERYFAPREVRALGRVAPDRVRDRFFDFWTLKESYIKALGLGLSLPLDRFSFAVEPGPLVRFAVEPSLDDDPLAWQFLLRSPTPEHRLAVALRRGDGTDLPVVIELVG